MKDKLSEMKKQKAAAKGDNEDEVKSNDSDDYMDREQRGGAATARRN